MLFSISFENKGLNSVHFKSIIIIIELEIATKRNFIVNVCQICDKKSWEPMRYTVPGAPYDKADTCFPMDGELLDINQTKRKERISLSKM